MASGHTCDYGVTLGGMAAFVKNWIGALLRFICISAVGHGFLLWLATKDIHPDQWVASMIGYAESAKIAEAAWYIIIGAFGLLGIGIWELTWPKFRAWFHDHGTKNQQPPNSAHKTDQTNVEEKRSLITKARAFTIRACRKEGEETDFRQKLEAYAPYFELRPHLSEDFRTKWNDTRIIHVFPIESNMPDIALFFLDELDRLEKEWGLR